MGSNALADPPWGSPALALCTLYSRLYWIWQPWECRWLSYFELLECHPEAIMTELSPTWLPLQLPRMDVCVRMWKIQIMICLCATLRGRMNEDKEKPWLTFGSFHSEQMKSTSWFLPRQHKSYLFICSGIKKYVPEDIEKWLLQSTYFKKFSVWVSIYGDKLKQNGWFWVLNQLHFRLDREGISSALLWNP